MPSSVRASLEQFTLEHPSGEGRLTISVAAPPVEVSGSAVPVIYVVDGDILFGLAAEIARVMSTIGGLPPHYIVGIGYDAAHADFLKLRTADLTPPVAASTLEEMGAVGEMIGGDRSGGADAFLAFITEDLRTEISAHYPQTRGGETVLFGHSLGGLFSARALLTRPDAFSTFIISSPSLWWDNFSLLDQLPAFRERLAALPSQPRAFVNVGGKEQDLPTSVPDGFGVTLEEAQAQIRAARMVDAAREFADALRAAGLTLLQHMVLTEEDHVSVGPAAILHGTRFALRQES